MYNVNYGISNSSITSLIHTTNLPYIASGMLVENIMADAIRQNNNITFKKARHSRAGKSDLVYCEEKDC